MIHQFDGGPRYVSFSTMNYRTVSAYPAGSRSRCGPRRFPVASGDSTSERPSAAQREHSPSDIRLDPADREELHAVIAQIYDTELRAHRLLAGIGFPGAAIPSWAVVDASAESFWGEVLTALDDGVIPQGYRRLLREATATYSGNERLRALYAHYIGSDASIPQAAERERDTCHVFVRVETEEERTTAFETLRRLGLDPREEFSTELVTSYSVSSADQRTVRALLGDSGLSWTVVSPDGPHYLLHTLTVQGPEGRRFRLRDTPAAETVGAIAAEVVATDYPESGPQSIRPTVISQVREEGQLERADPDQTLDEAGVQDGDQMVVAFEGRAG